MRSMTTYLVIGLLCVAVAGCSNEGAIAPKIHEDVLARADLQYYWTVQLELDPNETVARFTLLDENLYCLTTRHRLVAIDAARGLVKWSKIVAGPAETVFGPVHAQKEVIISENIPGIKSIVSPETTVYLPSFKAVIVNTVSYAAVYDRDTGELRRKIPFDFAANSAGAADGKIFYVPSVEGWYYAMRIHEAMRKWWLAADDMIQAPLTRFDKGLYVGDMSGTFIATDVSGEKGKKMWTNNLSGAVLAEFHVDARGCFVPCDDNRLYAFDPYRGRPLWQMPFVCKGPLRDPVQVADNTVFQYAQGDKFYAINLTSGEERWSRADGRVVLTVIDGEVYLLTAGNTLLIIDEMLGTVRASLPMTGWELFVRNIETPAVYAASRDGALACIREASSGALTPEMLK